MSQQINDDGDDPRRPVNRRWVTLAAAVAVVIVAAVLLTVFFTGGNDGTDRQTTDGAGDVTGVTSPYAFSELPDADGPARVADASYVSILMADEKGQLTGYGLNSHMPEAEALKVAVVGAQEVGSEALPTSTTALGGSPEATDLLHSTLTFVFPDRGTLTFDLYVEQGCIARGGRVWRVNGDLSLLIGAAVAAGGQ